MTQFLLFTIHASKKLISSHLPLRSYPILLIVHQLRLHHYFEQHHPIFILICRIHVMQRTFQLDATGQGCRNQKIVRNKQLRFGLSCFLCIFTWFIRLLERMLQESIEIDFFVRCRCVFKEVRIYSCTASSTFSGCLKSEWCSCFQIGQSSTNQQSNNGC